MQGKPLVGQQKKKHLVGLSHKNMSSLSQNI